MNGDFNVALNYELYLVYLEYESDDKRFKHKMELQPREAIALAERLKKHGEALINKI